MAQNSVVRIVIHRKKARQAPWALVTANFSLHWLQACHTMLLLSSYFHRLAHACLSELLMPSHLTQSIWSACVALPSVPRIRREKFIRWSFSFLGPIVWKSLPLLFDLCLCWKLSFESSLKILIFEISFISILFQVIQFFSSLSMHFVHVCHEVICLLMVVRLTVCL